MKQSDALKRRENEFIARSIKDSKKIKETIIVLCGVSGSGKTWVSKQLTDKFKYVPHDQYIKREDAYVNDLIDATKGGKTAITECPFGERAFVKNLLSKNLSVQPYFVIEPTDVVQKRYREREGKELSKGASTRTSSISDRAKEWDRPSGTSDEILKLLKDL